MESDSERMREEMIEKIPTPKELVERLDETVIGQEGAKKALSVAVYEHYKKFKGMGAGDGKRRKSNMMFIGPTGCGKTLLVETVAKFLEVPFVSVDSNAYTPAGFKGTDLEEIIGRLYKAADGDIDAAEHGIIFLDEFDKLAAVKSAGNAQDFLIGVQNGYLKLLEGSDIEIKPGWRTAPRSRKAPAGRMSEMRSERSFNVMLPSPQEQRSSMNTAGILFICGGAFTGLDKIIARRLRGRAPEHDDGLYTAERSLNRPSRHDRRIAGFNLGTECGAAESAGNAAAQDTGSLLKGLCVEDLQEFGFIPEILGRIPVRVTLDGLDEEALKAILTQPKDAILKQVREDFLDAGSDLLFTQEALQAIAREAIETKTGARGLSSIVDGLLLEPKYELFSYDHTDDDLVVYLDADSGKCVTQFVKKTEPDPFEAARRQKEQETERDIGQ